MTLARRAVALEMMRLFGSIALVCWGCGDLAAEQAPGEGGLTLSVLTPGSSVPLDGMSRVDVGISRSGGFAGPVSITGAGLPRGVTVTPTTIAAGATTGELVVGGAAPLAIGDRITYSIEATGEGVDPQTATVPDALVTGKPGALDTSFGPGTGLARVGFDADDAGAFQALDVVGGSVTATGFGVGGLGAIRMTTVRLTAAGEVDPTWAGGELVRTSFGRSSGDDAEAAAIGHQADGRSVVIGLHRGSGLGEDIALARFTPTGDADDDFGALGGKGLVDLGGAELVTGGLVLADGSIVAVGSKDGHFLIAKMSPRGLLDPAFAAPAGYDRPVLGSSSSADAVVADDQGRLVVAGTFQADGRAHLVIRRYTAAGRLDAAFGTMGQVIVAGPQDERAAGVRVQGDEIVLASTAVRGGAASFRVRRFLASGAPDERFGASGLAEAPVSAGDSARRMVVLADGAVVVLGVTGNRALLVRFTRRGELDPLFGPGGDGKAVLDLGEHGAPRALEVYSRHLVVIGGGDEGGTPGPGTFGVVARMWM
jgi:uncharacterized delta-60 repeat protein